MWWRKREVIFTARTAVSEHGISVICYPNACDLLPNRIDTHSHAFSCICKNYISSYIDSILQDAYSTAFTVHSTLQTHSQCIYIHSHSVLHSCIDALLTVSMKLHSRCILKSQLWWSTFIRIHVAVRMQAHLSACAVCASTCTFIRIHQQKVCMCVNGSKCAYMQTNV